MFFKLEINNTHPNAFDCILYLQQAEHEKRIEAHKMKVNPGPSSLLLQSDFRKFWISASCENEIGTVYSSNLLPPAPAAQPAEPIKNPAPAPAAAGPTKPEAKK